MQSLPSSRKLFPIEARTWSSASLSNTRNTSMDFAVVVTSNCCQENLNRVIPILLVLTVLWTFFLSSCITTCTAPGSTWGLSSPLCHLFFFFYPSWLRWRHTLLHHVWTGFVFLRRIAHPCHLYQRRRQELAQERRGLYCPQIVLVESIWEFFYLPCWHLPITSRFRKCLMVCISHTPPAHTDQARVWWQERIHALLRACCQTRQHIRSVHGLQIQVQRCKKFPQNICCLRCMFLNPAPRPPALIPLILILLYTYLIYMCV